MLWRALIRALAADGHHVVFFEHDVPWYAQHRDLTEIEGARLVLYDDWNTVRPEAQRVRPGAHGHGTVRMAKCRELALERLHLGPADKGRASHDGPECFSQLLFQRRVLCLQIEKWYLHRPLALFWFPRSRLHHAQDARWVAGDD